MVAIVQVIEDNFGAERDQLVQAVARLFGFGTTSAQLREVVEEILDAGKPFDFGLEVGSKPELFAGLAMQSQMGSLIICNGYKDSSFIKMALLGIKLGKKIIRCESDPILDADPPA